MTVSSEMRAIFGKPYYPTIIRTPDGKYVEIMSKKPGSYAHQAQMILESMFSPGRSKHADKVHNHGLPPRKRIYMSTTLKTYIKWCTRYSHWLRQSAQCDEKLFRRTQEYVAAYLQSLIDEGTHPNTIKTAAASLAKVFSCSIQDFGVQLPKRCRADRDFSIQLNKALAFYQKNPKLFCAYLACGLRKNKELAKITCADFRFQDGSGHIVGKNGRPRRFKMLPGLEHIVEKYVADAAAAGRKKPFCQIPDIAPVHHLRRMYACLWYLLLARPIEDIPREDRYCCKAELAGLWLDRKALLQVSSYLGHGRPNVTVDYIAPFVHCTDDGNLAITNPLSLFSGIDEYFLF